VYSKYLSVFAEDFVLHFFVTLRYASQVAQGAVSELADSQVLIGGLCFDIYQI
jgi:hypothetical protein